MDYSEDDPAYSQQQLTRDYRINPKLQFKLAQMSQTQFRVITSPQHVILISPTESATGLEIQVYQTDLQNCLKNFEIPTLGREISLSNVEVMVDKNDTVYVLEASGKEGFRISKSENGKSREEALCPPIQNNAKILCISEGWEFQNSCFFWALATDLGRIYTLCFFSETKKLLLSDTNAPSRMGGFLQTFIKPFLPPKIPYQFGRIQLFPKSSQNQKTLNIVSLFDFTLHSKSLDLTSTNPNTPPKVDKNSWQLDLNKKLPAELKKIVSVHFSRGDEKGNILSVYLLSVSEHKRICFSAFKVKQQNGQCIEWQSLLNIFEEFQYRQGFDNLETIMIGGRPQNLNHKAELNTNLGLLCLLEKESDKNMERTSILLKIQLNEEKVQNLSTSDLMFGLIDSKAKFCILQENKLCLLGQTSTYQLFPQYESSREMQDEDGHEFPEQEQKASPNDLLVILRKKGLSATLQELIRNFEISEKNIKGIHKQNKEQCIKHLTIGCLVCPYLLCENEGGFEEQLRNWAQLDEESIENEQITKVLVENDTETILSFVKYLMEREQFYGMMVEFFTKLIPNQLQLLPSIMNNSNFKNKILEPLMQILTQFIDFTIDNSNTIQQSDMQELFESLVILLHQIGKLDQIKSSILNYYILNFPEMVKNKATAFTSFKMFQKAWEKDMVKKSEFVEFLNAVKKNKEIDDSKIKENLTKLVKSRLDQLGKVEIGEKSDSNLAFLGWIPSEYEKLVLGLLKNDYLKIAIVYAIKIKQRKQAASYINKQPQILEKFNSPSRLYQILLILHQYLQDTPQRIIEANRVISKWQSMKNVNLYIPPSTLKKKDSKLNLEFTQTEYNELKKELKKCGLEKEAEIMCENMGKKI